jgi:hypothetical protein
MCAQRKATRERRKDLSIVGIGASAGATNEGSQSATRRWSQQGGAAEHQRELETINEELLHRNDD